MTDLNHTPGLPKLAMCNFIADPDRLRGFAIEHGFEGIDWSFDLTHLPPSPAKDSRWVSALASFAPLELRFHCPFVAVDMGHEKATARKRAVAIFQRMIHLVAEAGATYLTLHIGLGHDTTRILSWKASIDNLRQVVRYAEERGVVVCLENLKWGWTSKPNLFEKLVRRSGAGVTFDIGHAHACDTVRSQQFSAEDFVSPHPERVFNAHVYHTETTAAGHHPPENLAVIRDRLALLQRIGCPWWTLEIRDEEGLRQTLAVVRAFLKHAIAPTPAVMDNGRQLGSG